MCMYKYTHISMKSWNWKLLSRVLLFAIHGLYSPWNSLGQNTGVGSLSLLQGILPTQGTSPGLPPGKQILYQLSHEASPRILEWVAYPFSTRFPDPGIELGSPALQADSLSTELSGKPTKSWVHINTSSFSPLSKGTLLPPSIPYLCVFFPQWKLWLPTSSTHFLICSML